MKRFVTTTLLFFHSISGFSQSITYNWNSFTSGSTSYSNTQNGGCTMNANISGSEYNAPGMPRFTGTGTLPGANDGRNGLFIDQNWSTQTNTTTVTLNFSPAITNPCFTVYDINRNNPCGAFCSSAWNDRVIVSTTSGVVNATTGSAAEHNIIGNGTSAVTVDGKLLCNGTNANVQFCLTGSITNITIKYTSGPVDRTSGSGSCSGDPSGCFSSRTACPDPMRQYITIGNISGTSCCAATNPPSSISGNTGPFCGPTSTTLTAAGAASNSQWHTGSCSGPIIGTGSSIAVTPAATTTYYVNNLDCNNNPTSCVAITVTVTPIPATPTISNTGLSICTGNTTTLTSSSASGNTWSTGSTAQSIVVSAAGTYTLRVSSGGCLSNPASVTINTVSPPPTPTISANGPTTFCAGGSVVLSSSNVTNNTWSTGATTQTILVTASGTYSVVSGSGSCTSSSNLFTVTVLPNPSTPSITSTGNSICAGETATLTSSSATGNTWSNGSTAQTTTVNATGTYSLFIAGVNGCNSPATSINVNVTPVQPTPTITANGPANFCAGGSVVLTSSNATNNTWSTGATTQTILVSTTGNYSVTSGVGTCSVGSNVFNVNVNPLPNTPSITTSGNNLCSGQTATLTSSNPTNNVWSTGETTQSILITTTGTYSLNLTDANNCSSPTATIAIAINTSTLNVLVPQNILTCNGAITPSFNFTSTATNATYVWNNTDPSIGLPSNGTGSIPSFTATNNGSGVIEAIITVTPSADGCSGAPESFTISVNPAFVINAGANDTICFGSSTILNALPNISSYTYSWQPSAGLNNPLIINPTANPSITTNYTLTVTDANGCSGKDEVTIFANNEILSTLSATNTLCYNSCDGIVSVVASGGNAPYQYIWSNGITNALNTNLCAANYSVTIRDSWNCAHTNSVVLSEPTQVVASVSGFTNTLCFNDCNGAAAGSAVGGTGTYTFSWNTNPIQINSTALNLCAGIYKLKTTDSNGCTDSVNITISQPNSVTLIANPNVEICTGANATLTTQVTGGTPNYTYNWSPTTGLSNSNSPLVISSPSVNTVYTVTATDANGCLSNAGTVTVTIKAPISASANSSTICLGNSTPLTANVSGGSFGSYTFNWSPSAGLTTNTNQTTVANPTTTTVYNVTVNDGCSLAAVTQVTVTVLPLPIVSITATNTVGCAPLCVNLNDASSVTGSNIVSWQWTISGVGTSTLQNPQFCFNNADNYNITLTVLSADGCSSSTTFSNYVTVYPNPVADFEMPETVSVLTPEVNFVDQSIGATTWFWNFNDPFSSIPNQTSTTQNPSHYFSNQGTYCVNLTVTNIHGCVSDTTKCLDILPEFTIYVPNAFTPDDDNLNDFFTAFGVNIIEFELYIFDRWGEEIYYTNDITKGWNGKVKNGSQIAKQDVYVWKIKAKDIFNENHFLTGHVTLIKNED